MPPLTSDRDPNLDHLSVQEMKESRAAACGYPAVAQFCRRRRMYKVLGVEESINKSE